MAGGKRGVRRKCGEAWLVVAPALENTKSERLVGISPLVLHRPLPVASTKRHCPLL